MQTDVQGSILVVEDNPSNRDMLVRRLRRQGFQVEAAEHGRVAVAVLAQQPVDLILLDIMMPEMNGYQVLEYLKADARLRHIPVIVVSAIDELESIVRCLELGAQDYLFKPFNPVLLRARVNATLERKRLRDQEQAYLMAVQRDMERGRRIQAGFLPEQLPQPGGWEVAAVFQPAREVAGDFYDAFVLPGDRLVLVIADVCDKGVGAALFMALIRSLIRTYAEQMPAEPLLAVAQTNAYLTRHHARGRIHMFATLFFGVLDCTTGNLRYINAGHHAPMLLDAGVVSQTLDPTGPAVGLIGDASFAVGEISFDTGATLLCYTDGLTEARRLGGELFGDERLQAVVQLPVATAAALLAQIDAAVDVYLADAPRSDDMTLLAVRRDDS